MRKKNVMSYRPKTLINERIKEKYTIDSLALKTEKKNRCNIKNNNKNP